MTIHWSVPAWLWPLLLVVAAGAVLWARAVYRRSRPQPATSRRRLLVALRGTAFVLLVLAAAGPVLTRLGVLREPAELVVVVEDSASMGLADAGVDAAHTRWVRAQGLVADLEALAATFEPTPRVVVWRGNGLVDPVPWSPEPPVSVGTDLDALLVAVQRRILGRRVPAAVIVSDGQETNQGALGRDGGHGSVSATGLALSVLGVGDPHGPPDRLLADVRYPDTARMGDQVVVECTVAHRRLPSVTGSLRVWISGPEGVLADTVLAAASVLPVQLTIEPGTQGLRVYELAVSALDNERFLDNNRVSLTVDVRRDRRRLLCLAPRPGWDVRFLAQAAAAEARLELTVVHPTAAGLVRADSLQPWLPPASVDAWRQWDGVVVAGWPLPVAADSLAAAVAAGVGLCVLAPHAVGAGPPPADLARLLPVTAPRWAPAAGDVFVAAGGYPGHPLLAGIAADLGRLPPLPRVVPVEPRSGALVLLNVRARNAADAGIPLLVATAHGRGRSLWFGGGLWDLAFGEFTRADDVREAAQGTGRRLLRNLLVWTASGDEEAGLTFAGWRPALAAGERSSVAAVWRDMRGQPVTGRDVQLALRRTDADGEGEPDRTFSLAPEGSSPGVFTTVLPPLPPGRYEATLRGEGEPAVAGAVAECVVTARSVETTQTRRDQRRLERLAREWGGVALAAGPSGLPPELASALAAADWSPAATPRRSRWDPWSGWPFLAGMAALLGVEWYLRRRYGLL